MFYIHQVNRGKLSQWLRHNDSTINTDLIVIYVINIIIAIIEAVNRRPRRSLQSFAVPNVTTRPLRFNVPIITRSLT